MLDLSDRNKIMIIPLINPSRTASRVMRHLRHDSAECAKEIRTHKQLIKALRRNPNRPPKLWWDRTLAAVKAGTRHYGKKYSPAAIVGDIWFHKYTPKQRAAITAASERPASRRHNSSSKERAMVHRIRRRRHHVRRHHNPRKTQWGKSFIHNFRKRGGKKRHVARRRGHLRPGWHRPWVHGVHGKWFRAPHSRLFPHSVRLNPRHARYHHRRHYSRNPAIPFDMVNVAISGAELAAGFGLGLFVIPMYNKIPKVIKIEKYTGILNVLLGAVVASMVKQKDVQKVMYGFAGVGVYDLLSQLLNQKWLPKLPGREHAGLAQSASVKTDGEEIEGEEIEGDAYAPALLGSSYGSSYMGASYGDDIVYGGDGLEIE